MPIALTPSWSAAKPPARPAAAPARRRSEATAAMATALAGRPSKREGFTAEGLPEEIAGSEEESYGGRVTVTDLTAMALPAEFLTVSMTLKVWLSPAVTEAL